LLETAEQNKKGRIIQKVTKVEHTRYKKEIVWE
jgi:hypothetical protein